MIHFNVPPFVGTEFIYMKEAVENHKICGDGPFTKKCNEWLEKKFNAKKVMLTTSGTSALEMAAWLCNLQPGDEVILPSFTFSSTATAFALVGAKLVFVDVRPDTMNIDEKLIEKAILASDVGIVPVNDGKLLRLTFPQLTEERRKDIVKDIRKKGEESKVAVRNQRRDALDKLKALKKGNSITEDDEANGEKKIQNLTDKFCKEIDELSAIKEKEIIEEIKNLKDFLIT